MFTADFIYGIVRVAFCKILSQQSRPYIWFRRFNDKRFLRETPPPSENLFTPVARKKNYLRLDVQ